MVPGIMGSGLQASGIDHSGVPRSEVIWGESLLQIFVTLARNPALLGVQQATVTGVMREVNFLGSRVEPLYGPLLDYCCTPWGLDLVNGGNFRTFAYDWRVDLRDAAAKLAALVTSVPEPVYVVAHSMGGLITRLMLNTDDAAANVVKGVFQIASPVAGSSKAFSTIRRSFEMNQMADAMWKFFHSLDPTKRSALMKVIGGMPSLYQLLPPDQSLILMLSGGSLVSAVDYAAWLPADHHMVSCARDAHKILATAPSVPITCVFSTAHSTDWLIRVDSNWSILATQHQQANGDGTVTSKSAMAVSTNAVHVAKGDTEHTKLCANPEVHKLLKDFLS